MKKIEEGLYNEIFNLITHDVKDIKNYLDGIENESIKSWKGALFEEKTNVLFGNNNINNEEKNALLEMFNIFMEIQASSILRLFESDLYEIEGYNPGVDLDKYLEQNPNWKGSLVVAKDLKGDFITDNTMYENFIEYIEERKNK